MPPARAEPSRGQRQLQRRLWAPRPDRAVPAQSRRCRHVPSRLPAPPGLFGTVGSRERQGGQRAQRGTATPAAAQLPAPSSSAGRARVGAGVGVAVEFQSGSSANTGSPAGCRGRPRLSRRGEEEERSPLLAPAGLLPSCPKEEMMEKLICLTRELHLTAAPSSHLPFALATLHSPRSSPATPPRRMAGSRARSRSSGVWPRRRAERTREAATSAASCRAAAHERFLRIWADPPR